MKAFVTGATGFIGRALVDRLLENGVEVTALVRSDEHGLPADVKTVRGDILEPGSLEGQGTDCDTLYHLAGIVSFDPAMEKELTMANGQGTENILKMAWECGIAKSVVVSSACTFGISFSKDVVLDETSVPDPALLTLNPYMKSKVAAEESAVKASLHQQVVIVNPTTVYGTGDATLNSGTLIKRIDQSKILPVPPGGGNVIDISDVVEGIIQASILGKSGQKYILSGSNLSFSSLFSIISDATAKKPFFIPLYKWMRPLFSTAVVILGKVTGNRFFTRQIADDMFSYKFYSNLFARQELNWEPKCPFPESVKQALEFYKKKGLI